MIFDRYLGKTLAVTSLITLFILIAIFSFFSFVDQLDDIGVGNYGMLEVIQYVLFSIPRLSYELYPVATVIGSMITLGLLINNNELIVIRMSGVSQFQLAYSLMKTGLIFVLVSILIGEWIAPISEQIAQHDRSAALTKQISLKTKYGFWSRDGNSYINIRKAFPDDRIEDIYIYEFDNERYLRSSIYAKYAEYDKEKWMLHDILKTNFSEEKITRERYIVAEWETLFSPAVINLVTIKPRYLSSYHLINYIRYLKENNQNSRLYVQILWSKIVNPFSIIAMILLAVCVVKYEGRVISLGERVFFGALTGVIFHLVSQVSGYLGILYGIPAFISVSLPTILILSYVCYSLSKSH